MSKLFGMTPERDRSIAAVSVRAAATGKSVWVYDSTNGHGGVIGEKQKAGWEFDRICIEGDTEWVSLPRTKEGK